MRILGISRKWDKLNNPEWSTFRYPRSDRDWYVGEIVHVVYKNRSPQREELGIAQIIGKERRELDSEFASKEGWPLVTDEEAVADGFESRADMIRWMMKIYGLDYISLFNKLILRWLWIKRD